MKITIVGYGILGKAIHHALKDTYDISIIDPPLGYEDTSNEPSGYILCLPTPEGDDGECNADLIQYYLDYLPGNIPILIKSTINPRILCLLEDNYNFTYSPEFLREASSLDDFKTQDFAIFAGHDTMFWHDVMVDAKVTMGKTEFTSIRTAAYVKYSINTFLAMKVIYFNELHTLFTSDDHFKELCDLISMDKRIGDSHMMVPGPDGNLGFGGMCFPKDTKAFAHYARNQGRPLRLLEKVIELNEDIR